jgi:flagellar biosynthesis/type III secretory pathway chaperone
MKTLGDSLISLSEKKLASLRKCLQLMNEKTLILVSNDLLRLEESLERETLLLNELTELDFAIAELLKGAGVPGDIDRKTVLELCISKLEPQCSAGLLSLRNLLEATGEEIQQVIRKNAALIASGFQFTSAMLEVICPAQTYQPPGGGSQFPAKAIVSVSC